MREEKQFEVNDIKYRSLKVTGDKALIKVLYHTDSLCNISAEHMKESVVQEEEYLIERTKLLQLTGEKEREAEDLRKRAEKK
jgi:hypothetical protein